MSMMSKSSKNLHDRSSAGPVQLTQPKSAMLLETSLKLKSRRGSKPMNCGDLRSSYDITGNEWGHGDIHPWESGKKLKRSGKWTAKQSQRASF